MTTKHKMSVMSTKLGNEELLLKDQKQVEKTVKYSLRMPFDQLPCLALGVVLPTELRAEEQVMRKPPVLLN